MKRVRLLPILAVPFLFLFVSSRAFPCTIWAATGEMVLDGGTIIAKNRDNFTSMYTVLRAVYPEKGLPFYAIFDIEAGGYVTAGVNVKGVCVVNASPNSVPKKKRHVATEDLTERLLTTFDSVDAMIADKTLFQKSHPAIYIVGDNRKIASIEVAPEGKIAMTIKEKKGWMAFTNHYTEMKLAQENEYLSSNSVLRLRRIRELLEAHGKPFTVDDFIRFSEDKGGGPEKAIRREANDHSMIRTLASWIIHLPVRGAPSLSVQLANPDEPKISYTFRLDDAFWKEREREALMPLK